MRPVVLMILAVIAAEAIAGIALAACGVADPPLVIAAALAVILVTSLGAAPLVFAAWARRQMGEDLHDEPEPPHAPSPPPRPTMLDADASPRPHQ